MFNVTTVLPHNLLQTNPCIRHNVSTQVFRKRASQLHYVGPELRYIFWPPFSGLQRTINDMTFRAPPCIFTVGLQTAHTEPRISGYYLCKYLFHILHITYSIIYFYLTTVSAYQIM